MRGATLTLFEAKVWDPFYGRAFGLHKRVQPGYESLLFHLHRTVSRLLLALIGGVVNLNDAGRGLV